MDATQVPLDDGEYSIMILDAEDDPSGEQDDAYMLDVTILDGGHKGEVLSLAAAGLGLDPLDLLGMPGTLTVAQGVPSVVIENETVPAQLSRDHLVPVVLSLAASTIPSPLQSQLRGRR